MRVVGRNDFLSGQGALREQDDVVADDVEALRPILEEETVTDVIVEEVVLHRGVVGAVNRDRPVKREMHRAVFEILARSRILAEVPVKGVSSQQALLAGAMDLDSLDVSFAGRTPPIGPWIMTWAPNPSLA